MSDLGECNKEIYDNGKAIFYTADVGTEDMERFVKTVALLSGQRVDWHYFAGRAIIRYLGDGKPVADAIAYLSPILVKIRTIAWTKAGLESRLGVMDAGTFFSEI